MAEGNTEQTQLRNSWETNDFDSFCELLNHPDVSADHWYGDPVNATLLYLACEKGAVKYVKALLKAEADPNNLNQIRKKAPIHIAAERGDPEVLKALLEDKRTDVNIKDSFGDTPLHKITKQKRENLSKDEKSKYDDCLKLLLSKGGK